MRTCLQRVIYFASFLCVKKYACCNRTRCKWGPVYTCTYLILKEGRVGRKAGPEVTEEFAQRVVQVFQLLLDTVRYQLCNSKHTLYDIFTLCESENNSENFL